MEGSTSRPLPEDKVAKKSSKTKLIAIVVVVILIVAVLAAALILTGNNAKGPTAAATANQNVIDAGNSVTFNASTSTSSGGSINGYIWSFGDGIVQTTSAPLATHMYVYPGNYLVLLTVTDTNGKNASNWASLLKITVNNPNQPANPDNSSLPIAVVVVGGSTVQNGTSVPADASNSQGYSNESGVVQANTTYISNYTWYFGDGSATQQGNVSVAGNVTHVYTGDSVIYVSYVTLTSIHGAIQKFYFDVSILPTGGSAGKIYTFIEELPTGNDPQTLDPAVDYETAGQEVIQNVYETLVWYNGSSASNLMPMLATEVPSIQNGGMSADGLNYTFHIRGGVHFQNGELLTSADVVYSLQRALIMNDPNGPAWMLGQVMLKDFTPGKAVNTTELNNAIYAPDSSTVAIKLYKPYPGFLQVLAFSIGSIVSEKFVEAHGGTQSLVDNTYMTTHTCGTGPYSLVVWSSNQKIVLSRNDNYWRSPASIQVIEIKYVADFNDRLLQLQNGDADSIYVPRVNIDSMSGVKNVRISQGNVTLQLDFLGMNEAIVNSSSVTIGNIPVNFFADINVRKAFASAFNYSLFISSQMKGTAIQPNGPIPKGLAGYDANVSLYSYDLVKAKEYLQNATNPATGHSWYDDGFSITVYYNSGNTVRQGACLILQQGLQALSPKITVNIQQLDWSIYLGDLYAKKLPVFMLGWAPDYSDADDYANPFCELNGTYASVLGVQNTTMSVLVDKAGANLNVTQRASMYSQIQNISYQNAYYIWTDQATNYHVERSWISGYVFNPMYGGLYYYTYTKNV
jgi:peptide/nickel transport system substrate-binding protein